MNSLRSYEFEVLILFDPFKGLSGREGTYVLENRSTKVLERFEFVWVPRSTLVSSVKRHPFEVFYHSFSNLIRSPISKVLIKKIYYF